MYTNVCAERTASIQAAVLPATVEGVCESVCEGVGGVSLLF